MSDVDDLVTAAQRQLDEHKAWLRSQIGLISVCDPYGPEDAWISRIAQVDEIRLRVARASRSVVTVVYEYPDELYTWLSSDAAPKHLRDSLAGGHVVDPNQPALTVRREEPTEAK